MNYIIFDLECTCWPDAPKHLQQETIEIGALLLNDFGDVEDTYSAFIKPVLNPMLSNYCRELTHISQEQVNRAKPFTSVIEDFMDWAGVGFDDYVLASWGGFDKRMLMADCQLHRLDTDWLKPHLNLKQQYMDMRNMRRQPGLLATLEREGFEFDGTQHRAFDDAKNLARIFVKHLDSWAL